MSDSWAIAGAYLWLLGLPLVPSPELIELDSFIGCMACEQEVVLWLDGQGKSHEEKTVYTHCWNPHPCMIRRLSTVPATISD